MMNMRWGEDEVCGENKVGDKVSGSVMRSSKHDTRTHTLSCLAIWMDQSSLVQHCYNS